MCIDRSMRSNECCLLELSSRFDLIRAFKCSFRLHFIRLSVRSRKRSAGVSRELNKSFVGAAIRSSLLKKINRSAGAAPDRWALEGLPICWLLSSQLSPLVVVLSSSLHIQFLIFSLSSASPSFVCLFRTLVLTMTLTRLANSRWLTTGERIDYSRCLPMPFISAIVIRRQHQHQQQESLICSSVFDSFEMNP